MIANNFDLSKFRAKLSIIKIKDKNHFKRISQCFLKNVFSKGFKFLNMLKIVVHYKEYILYRILNNEKELRGLLGNIIFFNFNNKCFGFKINLESCICNLVDIFFF